jgi:hypothetical protein
METKMTYSNKLKDQNELLYCVDYAIVNDVDKDSILCIVDALLNFYRRCSQRDVTAEGQVHKYIEDSGLSSDELDMQCDCDDVTLFDVLEQFGSLSYNTLNEIRSRIEVI